MSARRRRQTRRRTFDALALVFSPPFHNAGVARRKLIAALYFERRAREAARRG